MPALTHVVEKELVGHRLRIEAFTSPHRYYLVTYFDGATPRHAGTVDAKGKVSIWTSAGYTPRQYTRAWKKIVLETVRDWLSAGGFIPATKAQIASARREAKEGGVLVLLSTGDRRRFDETRAAMSHATETLAQKRVGTQAALFRSLPGSSAWSAPFEVYEKVDNAQRLLRVGSGAWRGPNP